MLLHEPVAFELLRSEHGAHALQRGAVSQKLAPARLGPEPPRGQLRHLGDDGLGVGALLLDLHVSLGENRDEEVEQHERGDERERHVEEGTGHGESARKIEELLAHAPVVAAQSPRYDGLPGLSKCAEL